MITYKSNDNDEKEKYLKNEKKFLIKIPLQNLVVSVSKYSQIQID
jgi:hypothetical protein